MIKPKDSELIIAYLESSLRVHVLYPAPPIVCPSAGPVSAHNAARTSTPPLHVRCVISLAAKACATHACIAYPRNVYLEIEKVSYVFVWLELVLEDVVVQSEGVWS